MLCSPFLWVQPFCLFSQKQVAVVAEVLFRQSHHQLAGLAVFRLFHLSLLFRLSHRQRLGAAVELVRHLRLPRHIQAT